MRVLIVDDSRANRMVLQKFLRQLGHDTVEAQSGGDAIWLLAKDTNFHLITVDYHMPNMDGVQFTRLARENPALAEILILMITVEYRPELHTKAIDAGVTDILVKPFTAEMIAQKLDLLGFGKSGSSSQSTDSSADHEGESSAGTSA